MDAIADLHIHTTASDGRLTPSQAVAAAADAGLAAIAITDHDTVDGVDEALRVSDELGVEVVPGIELSTLYGKNNVEVHILGYFVDIHDAEFSAWLSDLKQARWERGKQMVEQLSAAGIPVTFERVTQIAGGGAIGRPHVARAICEVGAACSMDSAFGKYLQEGGIGYVARRKVEPVEAVRMILAVGGVASCAHLGKLHRDELVLELVRNGMQAIEVYHPDHGHAAVRFYSKFAQRHGLIATGGSDAHCFDGGRACGIGGITVDYSVVEQLKSTADTNALRRCGRAQI